MFVYPDINPIAIHIGPIKVYWYGLMYLLGFLMAWGLGSWRAKQPNSGWTTNMVSDLIFYSAIGVVLGGRIGYMLVYDTSTLIHQPLSLFRIWQGGMSFHGGVVGVILSMWVYARRYKKHFMAVMDFLVPLVPLGLAAGRVGNFINGELWGRVTIVPWGMIYPQAGPLPRHPSEIYEFLLEGIGLFILLWFFSAKPRPRMAVSSLFFIGYGCVRFFCEFFRQPDPQLGFVAWGWLTMGQLLSIPMIVIGVLLFTLAYRRPVYEMAK